MSRPRDRRVSGKPWLSSIVKPLSWLLVKKDWRRGERMPRTGGVIIAANHLSWSDPVLLAHFLYNNGRWPVVLAKSALFKVPFLGHAVRELRPSRSTAAAPTRPVAAGRRSSGCATACVIVLPRGHLHPRPRAVADGGQDRRRPAGADDRRAGDPGRPLGRAGAAAVREKKPRLFPRKTFHVHGRAAGRPVGVRRAAPPHADVLRAATADIMAAITDLLAELRGEKAPERRDSADD